MGSKKFGVLLLATLYLPLLSWGQVRRELKRTGAVPVQVVGAGPIMGPLKCGYDGSVYLRVLANQSDLLLNPVVRISADGKQTTRFSLNGVPELEKGGILDFAAGAHGDVYLPATDRAGSENFYVVTFDDAGTFVSKTKLQSGVSPNQLAVFSSGEFLISGRERTEVSGLVTYGKALTGIFDLHGQLVKQVRLPGDVQPKMTADSLDAAAAAEGEYKRALSLSTAESGDDGRVYLMRFAIDTPVFSITPAGEATPVEVRTPPGAYMNSIKIEGDKLVAMSVRKQDPKKARIAEVILSVWDLETGQQVEEFYHDSPALGAALVCYKSGVFTFVRTSDDGEHLELIEASADR